MSDSPNIYNLDNADEIHLSNINKTEANLRAELKKCQMGIETDTKKFAFVDDDEGYHTFVCEDTNGNVAIGNETTAARSEFDLYGAIYQTKTITNAENAIRTAVNCRELYEGSFPVMGLNVPILLTDNVIINGYTSIVIIPKYSSLSLAGWVGGLIVYGTESDAYNFSLAAYRGAYNLYWGNDPISGTSQFIETLGNYNNNIGTFNGDKNLNIFVALNEHGQTEQDCARIILQYSGSYQVQIFYKFEGAVQVPGNFRKY